MWAKSLISVGTSTYLDFESRIKEYMKTIITSILAMLPFLLLACKNVPQTTEATLVSRSIPDATKVDNNLASLTVAADQGNSKAQNNLGYAYLNGQGVMQNYAEAFKLFQRAADQGSAAAQSNLGYMYLNGQGMPKNDASALAWFKKAADKGNTTAIEAIEAYRKKAALGDAIAQTNLGVMYSNGHGSIKSYAEIMKTYSKNLSTLQDLSEALRWFQRAAAQGNSIAQLNIGLMYQKGLGVIQNDSESRKWMLLAAEQGNASAQYLMGTYSTAGFILSQTGNAPQINRAANYPEMLKWFRKSADHGHPLAQNDLGDMYANGEGVSKSYTEALKWYLKAANQGNTRSQMTLGIMYADGRGVVQNDTEALKWFQMAVAQGYERAQSRVLAMQKKISDAARKN